MTATASVDGTRGLFVIAAATDYARATLPGAVLQDVDILLDLATNKAPQGATWVWRTSFRVGSERFYIDVNLPPSPAAVTWRFFRQTGSDAPATVGALVTVTGLGVSANTPIRLQVQAEGTGTTTLRGRVWLASGTAPVFIERTSTTGPQVAGSIGTAIETPAAAPTNLPVTFYVDNLNGTNIVAVLPTVQVSGTVAADANVTGTLRVAVALSGTVTGRANVSATLNALTVPLGGTVVARATVAGVIGAQVEDPVLTGVIVAVAGVTGQFTVSQPPLPDLPPGGAIMSIADFAENAMLDTVFGRQRTPTPTWVPAILWVQLTSSLPTDSTAGTALLARAQATNDSANWPAASGGVKSNGLAISFGSTTGQTTHPTALGFEVNDAATGGNRIWWGTLRVPFSVNDRRTVSIPASGLRLTLD